jgi:hypothetical protein
LALSPCVTKHPSVLVVYLLALLESRFSEGQNFDEDPPLQFLILVVTFSTQIPPMLLFENQGLYDRIH